VERESNLAGSLLFLGIILLIFGGSSMGSVPTSYWLEQFKLFLFIGGCVLIIAAVVLMLRKR
jgi:ABC-type xylose transport system permease subunit